MDFKVEWFDRLASTNAHMHDQFRQGRIIENGSIIAVREQTAGRGRQDRVWLGSPDQNLCFSLFIETNAELKTIPSLTMAAALAVTESLNSMGIPARPKWPNDVLVGNKKICGILSERVEQTNSRMAGIIVGIGLNVNMSSEDAASIDRPATSMLIETGQAADLNKTLHDLFDPMAYWIEQWEKNGFEGIRDVWTQKSGPIGRQLTVHDGDIKKTGSLAGYGEHGELLLTTLNGTETIWSGDLS